MSPDPGVDRVAVISGGSRGVGLAIARNLAAQGMAIVLLHSPGGRPAAEAALAEISSFKTTVGSHPVDVADETHVADAFAAVRQRFGRIDVVVNGAGFLPVARLVDLDLADLDRLHRTLIRGVFVMCREAARTLSPGGSIVNLTSVAVGLDVPGTAAFVAGKAAVDAITPVLARELVDRDISVNAVAVGPTDANDPLLAGTDGSGPGRVDPDDIASLVGYLAGPAGHWLTGHVFPAGLTAHS